MPCSGLSTTGSLSWKGAKKQWDPSCFCLWSFSSSCISWDLHNLPTTAINSWKFLQPCLVEKHSSREFPSTFYIWKGLVSCELSKIRSLSNVHMSWIYEGGKRSCWVTPLAHRKELFYRFKKSQAFLISKQRIAHLDNKGEREKYYKFNGRCICLFDGMPIHLTEPRPWKLKLKERKTQKQRGEWVVDFMILITKSLVFVQQEFVLALLVVVIVAFRLIKTILWF